MGESMSNSRMRTVLCGIALLLALVAPAAAQETTGTIQGTVRDQSSAVLPGATVSAKHVQTGRMTDTVSNENGQFTLPALQPGAYEMTFSLSGFQSQTVKGIELHVNDRLEINGRLGVGTVAETIEVSSATSFVQPSPAVQTLMGPTQVQELPLNNRNFVQLATLVPGVSSDLSDEVGIGLTSTISISVNGGRRNAVNWMVDGVSNVDVGSNITLLSTPTLESIQEFKIITSSYAAEYPRSGGGVINIVTKGGGQKFSGTAYEFFRDERFNANSFFRNSSTNLALREGPAPLDYHNFGYTFGGPLLPSRQKAFFFWSQEWRKIERAGSTTATVPQLAWLNDPANANYVAPENRDPMAVKLLEAFPAPNQGLGSFLNEDAGLNNTRQEVIRVDFDATSTTKFTGRYTHDLSKTREPGGLFFGVVVPNVGNTNTDVPGQVAAFEARSSWNRILNEFKYQFSSNRITNSDPEGVRNKRSQFGINNTELFPENNSDRIPTIVIAGLSTFGATQGFRNEYFNHTLSDTMTWLRGKHGIKAGLMLAFETKNEYSNNETQGRYTFNATTGGRTAFQNFLTGNRDNLCTTCSYSESQADLLSQLSFNRYEAFVQDTWRPTSRLTVDLGVRYALYPAATDKDNVLSNVNLAGYNRANAPTPSTATAGAFVIGTGDPLNGIIVAGQNSPFGDAIYETDKNNFMPRIGASYDPIGDGKTIVRSGYGLYYDQPLVGIFLQNAFINPPFNASASVTNPVLGSPAAGLSPTTRAPLALRGTGLPFRTPQTQQWNIGLQRQLYRRGAIDVSYVGSRGDHLLRPIDVNFPNPADVVSVGAGSVNTVRPYFGYAGITIIDTTARSRYWGLLTSFRHDAGRAGTLSIAYTLSRSRTDATNDRDAVDVPQNPLDVDAEYADARSDRRHIFNATYVYELPFFKASENLLLKTALGGWQISGITSIQSGAPVPRILTATTTNFTRGNRANVIGDPKAGEMDFPFWFDPAAYGVPAQGTYGDSPRAPIRLPGRNQTDLALSKNFYPFSKRIQFRADAINAFNHTQFSAVNADCSGAPAAAANCAFAGSTVGQITGTRAPREFQFSLKLYW